MSAAAKILEECLRRDVRLQSDGHKLIYDGPESAITDELLARLRAHKPDLLAHLRPVNAIEQACSGIPGITPAQFDVLLSDADRADIHAGEIPLDTLRAYAQSFAAGILSGRIRFAHDGRALECGVRRRDRADAETMRRIRAGEPVRVYSQVLRCYLYWVRDDAIRDRLLASRRIKPWRVYTLGELVPLIGFPPEALRDVHRIRRGFNGRIQPRPAT